MHLNLDLIILKIANDIDEHQAKALKKIVYFQLQLDHKMFFDFSNPS